MSVKDNSANKSKVSYLYQHQQELKKNNTIDSNQ